MSEHFEFYVHAGVRKWFLLALLFGCLFIAFTALYASGVMNRTTLEFERWLIGRPLTQFDCVLVEWRNFGAATFNLIFIALIGIICGLTRFRWRVLFYLLILILVGIAIEEIGKRFFSLPVSLRMHSGMAALTWLLWRHIKSGSVRWPLVILILLLSFLGAAIQLYVGAHFIIDTFAGYLIGTSLACCAIGLLILNEKKHEDMQLSSVSPAQGTSSEDIHASNMT